MVEFSLNDFFPDAENKANNSGFSNIALPYPEAILRIFTQNTPVQNTNREVLGTPFPIDTEIDGVRLPIPPIVTITGQKTVVKTAVAGRDFTVKEIISLEDYRVNIKGFCINTEVIVSGGLRLNSAEYPFEWLESLRAIYEKNEAVKVYNELLSRYNIEQVVIESFRVITPEGSENYFAYELDCISDRNVELELIDDSEGFV